jgi:hypothetical protein
LANISGRGFVSGGDNVLIGGFIVTGSTSKEVVVRGIGPSLAQFGLNQVLPDPTLSLFSGSRMIAANDDYVPSPELSNNGLAPGNTKESAIVTTLSPGPYTAILRDKNGSAGFGLLDVYDIGASGSQLINVSVRGRVESGDNVLIGGFIIGTDPAEVVVRGSGPSLASYGITDPLTDPAVALYNFNGVAVASNQNWKDTQQLELTSAGYPMSDDREAAVLTVLGPGAYTAIVTNQLGTLDSQGIALLEIYNAGNP